jgi:hypothetical protein
MSRLAHNVSSRFKDYKCDGSLEKPISEYIVEYDAVAKDFDLVLALKLRFFHLIFSGSANRFYFAQVEPVAISYTDAKLRMCNEFNSPSRQQRILQMVSTLTFSQFLKDDHRNALNDLAERISTLAPMCPTTHKQDAHLKKFLHDACIGEQWASADLSRTSAEPDWTLHMMATHWPQRSNILSKNKMLAASRIARHHRSFRSTSSTGALQRSPCHERRSFME